MIPYFLLFAFFAAAALATGSRPITHYPRGLMISAVILIIFIGLRYDVGSDWGSYLIIFDYIRLADFGTGIVRTEPGYAFLNWLGARLGLAIWFPNLICAAIFTWGLVTFCRRQPNPPLALVVALPYLIVGVSMAFTRQSAALGLVMIGLTQYIDGKIWRMVLSFALAATFHNSAIVAIPIVAAAAAQRGVMTTLMVALLGGVLLFQFSGNIASRLSAYTQETFSAGGAAARLAMNVVPALIYLGFRNRFSGNATEQRLWTTFALASLASILLIFFVSSSTLVDRLGIYLAPLQIFVLSRLPAVTGKPGQQSILVVTGVLTYSLAVEVVWFTYGEWAHAWIPYQNYLWKDLIG